MQLTNKDINRAYSRGYNAGRRGAWPHHLPPAPPHDVVRGIIERAKALRDEVDVYLSSLCEDDELQDTIGKRVDEWDQGLQDVEDWIRAELEKEDVQ